MKSKFKVKDKGFDRLARKTAGVNTLKIGVLGSTQHDSKLTNAQLAIIHEFGTKNTPSRSFLRSTFDAKNKQWQKFIEQMTKFVFDGRMTEEQVLGLLGEKAVADVRAKIRSGIKPALKASTIRNKGSSKPLIDSGRLVNAIGWQIVKDQK